VLNVVGLDKVAEYPGVTSVSMDRKQGDEVDWRKGSHEYVFTVLARLPDTMRCGNARVRR